MYPPQRFREIVTGLLVPLVLIAGLGGGELVLRFQQGRIFGVQEIVGGKQSKFYYVDEETGLRLPRPNSRHGLIVINSAGFRGPELQANKSKERVRIAYIGSSTTYDADAGIEKNTWPAVATDTLSNAFSGCRIEYLNAGAPGLRSDHILKHFRAHVASLSPDIVIVLTNDLNSDSREQAEEAGLYSKFRYTRSWLAKNSLLWSKIEKNLFVLKTQRQAHNPQGKLLLDLDRIEDSYDRRMDEMVNAIARVVSQTVILKIATRLRHDQTQNEQTRAANSRLFYMPYATISDILSGIDRYNKVIDRYSSNDSVTVLDPEAVMVADDEHFKDTSHTTTKGSRILGEFVGQALAENPTIQSLVEKIDPNCKYAEKSAPHMALTPDISEQNK